MATELDAMLTLAQRLCSPRSRWHIGDLGWEYAASDPARRTIRVWQDGDTVTAYGWLDVSGHLDLLVDPAFPGLAGEVVAWARASAAPGAVPTAAALETERHLIDAFTAAGYVPDAEAPYFTHHHIDLEELAEPILPKGFRLRHVREGEAEARAAVHRASWSDAAPSRMSTERYARVMAVPVYRADLDWVVETDAGEMVASSLGWLDNVNAVGLLEPVGCATAYRRRGLSRACNLAVLHAFRAAGAKTARVCPRGDDGYPVPGLLYRAIGFRPGARTVVYRLA